MANELTLLPDDVDIVVTQSQLTRMFLESHRKAQNTAEEVMCLKEIGKINGLYKEKPTTVTVNIDQHIQRIEKMSDEELLRIAGADADLLSLPDPIEAEYEEVKE